MGAAQPPIMTGGPPATSPAENALTAGRERREADQAILYWEQERRRLGPALSWMTLNFPDLASEQSAYWFIVSVAAAAEDCAFLFYGAKFAALMRLPDKANPSISIAEQLPARYLPVFTNGSIDATFRGTPVRMEGTVEREDGQRELYRSVFIPLSVKPNGQQRLAFGAFNCRVNGASPAQPALSRRAASTAA